jgi:hypothetical protein
LSASMYIVRGIFRVLHVYFFRVGKYYQAIVYFIS